ncbi:MAG: NAD-dependent epimerase/dehydratase family protein [Candidatus Sumerlaeia bacterium]
MLLITGASGFLGSAVARMAHSREIPFRAMVRESSRLDLLSTIPMENIVRADMSDAESLKAAVKDVDAVIHCAATTSQAAPDLDLSRKINVLGTMALLDACRQAGVKRFVQISSQSAHKANPSVYGRTKLEADRHVRAEEKIEWTILKPSIIYGAESKGIFDKMVQYCRKLPVIPIIGPGTEEMRPVLVDEVAWAALKCLETPESVGKTYDIGGADVLEFQDFIQTIMDVLGKRKPMVHLPLPVALKIAEILSKFMDNPPLTPDNVRGIQTVQHVDISEAREDLGFEPLAFREGLEKIWGVSGERRGTHGSYDLFERDVELKSREDFDAEAYEDLVQGETEKGKELKPLRFAVIGLGKMGVMHASMCGALPHVEVAALVDLDKNLGNQVKSMGVDAPFFEKLKDLWESGIELDGAIIATPQFTHRQVGIDCLKQGLHVFCEKPLAHNIEDAEAMAEEAARHPSQVTAIGFMKGHYALWQHAVQRLQEGWIGQVRRFRASVYLSQVMSPKKGWTFTKEKSGGGILINSGIHLIQYLCCLFGNMDRVKALARPMHSEVEDTLAALVEFESGVFGNVDMSWSVPGYQTEDSRIFIEADEGCLEISDDAIRVYRLSKTEKTPKGWSTLHREDFENAAFNLSPDYGGEGYYRQLGDFAHAIRNGGRPRYDWQEGLRIQKAIAAFYESMESGNTVSVKKK